MSVKCVHVYNIYIMQLHYANCFLFRSIPFQAKKVLFTLPIRITRISSFLSGVGKTEKERGV